MNAAFLLITTAWMAGGDTPPAKPAPAAPAATAHANGCCGDTCDDCCRPKLLDRLKGLFHRDCDDCNACDHKAVSHDHHDCGCADDCCRPKLLDRLRGWFHRGDCCDDCCGASTAAPAKAEPIKAPKSSEPPKKMPEAPAKSVELLRPNPVAPAGSLIIEQ